MQRDSQGKVALSFAFCTLLLVPPLLGQYGTGTILGTVTDPSGAVVPGVAVKARNNATNESREFVTDSSGSYQFNALPSGTYTITATGPSFKTATVENLVLRVNTQVRADISMQLGVVAETVQVEATTPQLQTNTAVMGTVIDNRTMLELPLNARNFFDLVALTPGALKTFGTSSVMDERSIEIAGVRNTATGANLDGVDFTVINQNNPGIALSLDALSEFKVQTNFMDASYGHGAAGIDMVTKRGSNGFHGVAYDFVRNRAFQAGQYFRPASGAPRFSYNQFGFNVGGPVRKDKTFYFGNYEGRRRRTGVILQGLVPTEQQMAGDFSATGKTIRDPLNDNQPFPGNTIPRNRFDPITEKMIQYFPKPNLAGRPGVNFLVTPSDWERRDQFTARLDHRLSEKGNLFGRYSFADDDLGNAAYIKGLGLIRPDRTQHLSVGYTHLFSPTFISDTRLGFFKAYLARTSDGDRYSKNYAAELGLKNLAAGPGDYTLPNIGLTGYAPGYPTGTSGFVGYGLRIVQNNIYYRFSETATWIRNNHTLKFGGDFSHLLVGYDQGSNQNGIISFSGNYTGDAPGDYLLGLPASASGGLGSVGNYGGVAKYSIADQVFWFVQDDWRISDRLTLNLGVRWEYQSPYRGRLANFDLATGRQHLAGRDDYYQPGVGLFQKTGTVVLPNPPIRSDWNNYGPRVGFAYRLGANTTIRSGAGLFFAYNGGGAVLTSMMGMPPYFVYASLSSSPTRPEIRMADLFPPPEKSTTGVTRNQDLNQRTGYLFNYNFNIQHQIRPGLLFETGYMGNTAQKQYGDILVNQPRLPTDPNNPEPWQARIPYPHVLVPGFSQNANYQWSNYNAGFLKLEQRPWHDLSFSVAYTFSKLMDSGAAGQNMYNRRPERGLAGNHVPHNFMLAYVWQLPIGRGKMVNVQNAVLDAVIGGWELSGITNFRSGMYFTIGVSGDLANVLSGARYADATGVKPKKLDPRTNNLLGFDRAAYATPARGVFGNLSRNTQQGFGINNWDVGVNKNFQMPFLGESGRLQIRAEWFNFWNHTQFRGISSTVNIPSNFGVVNSTYDPRILQVAGKLYW
ncbi:MAG: TonB-dependent receptor [Bryobacterales bacterium]|nr:TonB-dependent receptor [Bryobacterales bacterium]